MKLLLGAAAAALLFAAPAIAQTPPSVSANCSGFAPAPTLADGATANRTQVGQVNTQYEGWSQARVAKLQLCRAEVEALRAQLHPLEEAYNSATTELNTVTANWQAEVTEFNARGGSTPRRERGGVLTRPD